MTKINRLLAAVCMFALAIGPLGTAVARAQTPATVAQASGGTIVGQATDPSGNPLVNVTITANGPSTQTTTSDANGAFALRNLTPGLYRITATKPGYDSALQTDYPVIAGQQSSLNVTLAAATLTSLREIGRVSVNAGARSTFNSTPASVVSLNTQAFIDQQQPQVQRVLDQTPGIVIDHPGTNANNASPGAITLPSIRGGLAFETASLIDGHPLAVGSFGDYVSTFLNAYALQNVEIIKGPGAAAPQVNFAINGTVNFRTLDPTTKPQGQIVLGMDSFGGQFSNFKYTGTTSNGKLGWALDYGVVGTPGPTQGAGGYVDLGSSGSASSATGVGILINGQAVTAAQTSAGTVNPNVRNFPNVNNTTLLGCCLNAYETYTNKTELVKLRYNLSPVTTFTASYLGSQTWTDQNGNHLYQFVQNFAPGATYTGGNGLLNPGPTPIWFFSYNPYPTTEWEINNEPIFQGEIRTTFHDDIVLARYYAASINRLQYNSVQNQFQSVTYPLQLFGTVTTTAGTQTFNGQTAQITLTPATSPTSNFCQNAQGYWITQPNCPNGVVTDNANGPYFRSMEEDKLHGGSFEYDHFLGSTGNTISFAYDYVKMMTASYGTGAILEFPQSVPAGSFETFQTALLRGIFNIGPKLNVTLSNYLNMYWQHYTPNKAITAAQNTPGNPAYLGITGLVTGSANPLATYVDQKYTHYDGRLGLAYRMSRSSSLRFAAGSAIAPPYLFLLSAATTSPVQTGICSNLTCYTNTVNAGNTLRPETSFGYDIGGDFRLSSDGLTVLTTDLYRNNLYNQFVTSLIVNGGFNGTTSCTVGSSAACLPLYSSVNMNLSNARYDGFELGITRDPALGFGFVAQGALIHAYPYNISPCFYSQTIVNGVLNCSGAPATNLAIVSGVNYQNTGLSGVSSYNSISNHALPYSQGYGELHYRFPMNGYLSFGMQYYGNNNSLNVPAFWLGNMTARVGLGSSKTLLAMSIDNLFNIYSQGYATAWGGTCIPLVNGQCGLTNAYSIGPRNVRLSLTRSFGQ